MTQTTPENAAWKEFLLSTRSGDLVPADFKLIFVPSTAVIPEVIKVLVKNNISSVPVMDVETNQFSGLIDMIDLLTLVVATAEAKELVDVLCRNQVDWETFIQTELQVFRDQTIADMTNISERNPWAPVWEGFPLSSLLDMFSKNVNLHRVPIIDGDGNVVGLVSQSRVLEFLHKNIDKFPDADITVDSFWKPGHQPLVSVPIQEDAITAFKQMFDFRVSGLPVVDSDNKIVGSISASDLKGSTEETLFSDVKRPLKDYLANCSRYFKRDPSSKPITCTINDTLKGVMAKLIEHRIHRIFITDDDNTLEGVLSLCDVISVLSGP